MTTIPVSAAEIPAAPTPISDLAEALGGYLVALAGSSRTSVIHKSVDVNRKAVVAGYGMDSPLISASLAAGSLFIGRGSASEADKPGWSAALVAVETLLEDQLARLDRVAAPSGEEAVG